MFVYMSRETIMNINQHSVFDFNAARPPKKLSRTKRQKAAARVRQLGRSKTLSQFTAQLSPLSWKMTHRA